MFSAEELKIITKALKSHKIECCNAIDSVKKTVGKDDPVYKNFAAEYYEDIKSSDNILDKIREITKGHA